MIALGPILVMVGIYLIYKDFQEGKDNEKLRENGRDRSFSGPSRVERQSDKGDSRARRVGKGMKYVQPNEPDASGGGAGDHLLGQQREPLVGDNQEAGLKEGASNEFSDDSQNVTYDHGGDVRGEPVSGDQPDSEEMVERDDRKPGGD